jgi:hypothetical protein
METHTTTILSLTFLAGLSLLMPRVNCVLLRSWHARRIVVSGSPYLHDAAHRVQFCFPCPHCPIILLSESGRTRHITQSLKCREAEQLLAAVDQLADNRRCASEASEAEHQADQLVAGEPETAMESIINAPEASPPNKPAAKPLPSLDPMHILRFAGGARVYVERFPDARAGAPVSDIVSDAPDLCTYLSGTGNLGNPDLFETAELLMTTGLTSGGHDRHLKSRLVSQFLLIAR